LGLVFLFLLLLGLLLFVIVSVRLSLLAFFGPSSVMPLTALFFALLSAHNIVSISDLLSSSSILPLVIPSLSLPSPLPGSLHHALPSSCALSPALLQQPLVWFFRTLLQNGRLQCLQMTFRAVFPSFLERSD